MLPLILVILLLWCLLDSKDPSEADHPDPVTYIFPEGGDPEV
jgi:hypothetical protein